MLFENMGLTYLGPVDGHNMRQMMKLFNEAKRVEGPVVVHVLTKKGMFVVFRSRGRVRALGSGEAEFVVFRGRGRVRALRGGVRRLPGPRPSPSPGSGEAEFIV